MKKFLVCLVLLCGFSTISFAQNNKQEVVIDVVNPDGQPSPRSLTVKPKVFIDVQMCELSVSFAAITAGAEPYTLYVCDKSGAPIYSAPLVTDSNNHMYQLPTLEAGQYAIRIESSKKSFEGEFSIF